MQRKRLVQAIGIRRSDLAAARMWVERNALAALGARRARRRARVLCYHGVGTPQWGVNDVSPGRFRRQIELALDAGHRFVPAQRIATGSAEDNDLAITFDDGLTSVAVNAASVLADYHIPWTLFIVSDWVEGRHGFGHGVTLGWDGVSRLAAAGATIGSHSVTHPDFARLTVEQMRNELCESRRVIESRTGILTTAFAIPFGQSMNWSRDAGRLAHEAGYETVFAQSEDRRPVGTVARTFITRFDDRRLFSAALGGAFDRWEEWF